ncbi:MAG: hypothetical protein HQK54_08565, partial [Oligoflexales bacterium]|nr:hypothetical protein [Oligoflexales bacterium]
MPHKIWDKIRKRFLLPLLTGIMAAFLPAHRSLGDAPVDITASDMIPLGPHFSYYEDPEAKLSIKGVLADNSLIFRKSESDIPSFGYSKSAFWFRVVLSNPLSVPVSKIIELAFPLMDDIEFYLIDSKTMAIIDKEYTGDMYPFSHREIKFHNFTFNINLSPSTSDILLIRVKSEGNIQVPVYLWKPLKFYESVFDIQIIQGIFFGFMIIIFMYNFFIGMVLREKSYILYLCLIVSLTLLLANIKELPFEYVWPEMPEL